MKSTVFTISRQYGSGGHEVGEKLATKLGIPFYDNDLITRAAQKSGVSKEIFEQVDEKPTNSFLYSLSMGAFNYGTGGLSGYTEMSINDKLFLAQSDVIKEMAREGSCVIVGRCADYVLQDLANCVNVYCYATHDDRVARTESRLKVSRQQAVDAVRRKDKTMANYYNYYSNNKWGDAQNYDLMINTSKLPTDETVRLIMGYASLRNQE